MTTLSMSQGPLLEELAELLEREHSAIAMIDVPALEAIELERRALLARVGPLAPPDRPAYDAVESLRARNERAAELAMERLAGALGRIARGRAALAGYRSSTGGSPRSRGLNREV